MKFVEDTDRHSAEKEQRKLAKFEALTGGGPSTAGHAVSPGARSSARSAVGVTGGSNRSTPLRRPASAAAGGRRGGGGGGDGRDEFFQRLRDDLDRRNR